MSAADVFERVAKRCPFQPGSGKWCNWISEEMRKTEDLDTKILAIRRAEEDERRRHGHALQTLRDKLKELQRYCDHEMERPTAQCEPSCKRCGWEDSGPGGYDG
jgi:hypothetical protein